MASSTDREARARFRQLLFRFRRRIAVLLLLALATAICNGVLPYATGRFLDSLLGTKSSLGDPVMLLGLWAGLQSTAFFADWLGDKQNRRLQSDISLEVNADGLAHLLRLPIAYHRRVPSDANLRRITEAGSFMSQAVFTVINVLPQFLSILIGMAMALTISVPLALILLSSSALILISMRKGVVPSSENDLSVRDQFVETWARATAAVDLVETVKHSTAEDHEIAKLRDGFLGKLRTAWYGLDDRWLRASGLQKAVSFVTQFAILATAIFEIRAGDLTIGELVAFLGYAAMYLAPMSSLGQHWESVRHGLTAARQLESVLSEEPEVYDPPSPIAFERRFADISFKSVSFAYDAGGIDILSDVSVTIPAGSVVAIVGRSGAGKSTLVSLLSGYQFPTKGDVLIGGISTRRFALADLRRQIAIVPQEVALFNTTIRENIQYGVFDATEAEMLQAAHLARVDDYVRDLPDGYDTIVGERGLMLSVGQKQRIAIARSILRNPAIFIFDEPTSSLDAHTEQNVSQALKAAVKGRTAFIIAHRLATVRNADLVLALEGGRVCEAGSPERLMAVENGFYRRMLETS